MKNKKGRRRGTHGGEGPRLSGSQGWMWHSNCQSAWLVVCKPDPQGWWAASSLMIWRDKQVSYSSVPVAAYTALVQQKKKKKKDYRKNPTSPLISPVDNLMSSCEEHTFNTVRSVLRWVTLRRRVMIRGTISYLWKLLGFLHNTENSKQPALYHQKSRCSFEKRRLSAKQMTQQPHPLTYTHLSLFSNWMLGWKGLCCVKRRREET